MNHYQPEGYEIHNPANWRFEQLQNALLTGEILEAPVTLCDEAHDLHIDLSPYHGLIPRMETSIGIREDTAKEISILSMVGKQAAFQVRGRLSDGTWLLSRADAQEEALEYLLSHHTVGDILPAIVTNLTGFGAFCDIGCGVAALLGIENISVSRIRHPEERFSVGQKIYAVISHIDRESRRITLSHKELLGTWEENAARFTPGQTVVGTVRGNKPYGVFIELTPNLSGLAEPTEGLQPGDCVSVFIKSILPQKRKIKLTVIQRLDAAPRKLPLVYRQTEGHLEGFAPIF